MTSPEDPKAPCKMGGRHKWKKLRPQGTNGFLYQCEKCNFVMLR